MIRKIVSGGQAGDIRL